MQAIIQGNLSKNKVGKSRNKAQPSSLSWQGGIKQKTLRDLISCSE